MARARWRDPRGDQAHLVLAGMTLFMLPLGTAPLAIMFAIAIGYSLLRLWATAPAVGYLIRLPVVWFLLALLGWTLLSLNWSSNRAEGWDEASILRFQLPCLILLWPIIDRWRALTLALGGGVAVVGLIQLGQWAFDGAWPMFLWWHAERIPGRFPGLVHPSSTAVVAVASILLLPRVMTNARRLLIASPMWLLAWFSLVLSGSRGGWIAVLIGLLASIPRALRVWRGLRRARLRRPSERVAWISGSILAIVALAMLLAFGSQISTRVHDATADLRAALKQGDYSGDVAARWRQYEITWHIVREHPLVGAGVGDYLESARRYVRSQAEDGASDSAQPVHSSTGLLGHPHSSILYHLAVLGWPGVLLYVGMWLALAVEAVRRRVRGLALNRLPVVLALFAAFALDSHHMSAPGTLALMFVIAVVCYETRPEGKWVPPRDSADARPDPTIPTST